MKRNCFLKSLTIGLTVLLLIQALMPIADVRGAMFKTGDTVVVSGSSGANVRAWASTSSQEITDEDYLEEAVVYQSFDSNGYAPPGATGIILEGPQYNNGYTWWKVQFNRKSADNNGNKDGDSIYTGWVADLNLASQSTDPALIPNTPPSTQGGTRKGDVERLALYRHTSNGLYYAHFPLNWSAAEEKSYEIYSALVDYLVTNKLAYILEVQGPDAMTGSPKLSSSQEFGNLFKAYENSIPSNYSHPDYSPFYSLPDIIPATPLPQLTLSVTPDNQNVPATAGTTVFTAYSPGQTINWPPSITSGSSWLSIGSGNYGANNTATITVDYAANSETSPRVGTIVITAFGAAGSPKTITVTQAASSPAPAPAPAPRLFKTSNLETTSGMMTYFSGSNFTPWGGITVTIVRQDGAQDTPYHFTADDNGNLDTSYSSGNYTTYWTDDKTGGRSNTVTETYTPPVNAPAPAVDINASNKSIPYNSPVTISWSSANATRCIVNPDNWDSLNDKRTVTLIESKTYTITCTGTGGKVKKSISVEVEKQGVVAVDVRCNGLTSCAIDKGQSATISWTSNGASCTSRGLNYTANGSFLESPSSTTVYDITCIKSGWTSSTKSATVTVREPVVTPTPCVTSGCSGEACVSEGERPTTTCEITPDIICLKKEAVCERQTDGQCGWTRTPRFPACLEDEENKKTTPLVQTCSDGTPYGTCSTTKPKYCSNNGYLENYASQCECPSGQIVQEGKCITPDTAPPTILSFTINGKDHSWGDAVVSDTQLPITIAWDTSDNVRVKEVQVLYADGTSGAPANWELIQTSAYQQSSFSQSPALGTHYYGIHALDSSNNKTTESVVLKWVIKVVVQQATLQQRPPAPPTNLLQLKPDGKTPIGIGQITNDQTVVFKARVSDPNNDKVKLQVELRRIDEYNGSFDEYKGDLKESVFVQSGAEAEARGANGLINGNYHWRARAIDEKENKSDWVGFGNNSLLDVDFMVQTASQPSPPPKNNPACTLDPQSNTYVKEGMLLKSGCDPTVYLFEGYKKRRIVNFDILLQNGFQRGNIRTISSVQLNKMADGEPLEKLELSEGAFVKEKNRPAVYMVQGGYLRHLPNEESGDPYGYARDLIRVFSPITNLMPDSGLALLSKKQWEVLGKIQSTGLTNNIKTTERETLDSLVQHADQISNFLISEQGVRLGTSVGVGFVPIVGELYDIYAALAGYDPITQERLDFWERGLTAGAVFIPAISGPIARKGGKVALDAVKTFLKNEEVIKGIAKGARYGDNVSETIEAVKRAGIVADPVRAAKKIRQLDLPRLSLVGDIGNLGTAMKIANPDDVAELKRIKMISNSNEKGAAGEEFWQRFVPNSERSRKIKTGNQTFGDRIIDVRDVQTGRAFEIKNYSNSVPASTHNAEEVQKDVFLRSTDPSYKPIWVFIDAGPDSNLIKLLEENEISYIILSE